MVIKGKHSASEFKFAIILSLFNEFIGQKLLDGALNTLKKNGCPDENIDIIKVPGAFEIPVTADVLLSKNKYDAVICLGAIIKGKTPHFEYICQAVSSGITQVAIKHSKPVLFGVLTTDDIEQALQRASNNGENKGADVSLAAIEMVDIMRKL